MSTLFYVSYAALWLLLLTIGVLVLLLYRHFGVMSLGTLEGVQRDGLPIGSVAPPISGVTAAGQDTSWQPKRGQPQLLLFAAPDCEPCATVLPHVERLARAVNGGLGIAAVVPGPRDEVARFVERYRPSFPCLAEDGSGAFTRYRVRVTPFGFVVGSRRPRSCEGALRRSGPAARAARGRRPGRHRAGAAGPGSAGRDHAAETGARRAAFYGRGRRTTASRGTSGDAAGDGESMTTVERVGEGLARLLNRRQMLKRAAVAVFGAVAAWTVEGFRGNSALAQQCGYRDRRRLHLHPARRGSTAAGWTRRSAPASAMRRRLLLRRVVSLRRRLLVQRHLSVRRRRVRLLPVLRLQLLRAAVRLPGVHLDRLSEAPVPQEPSDGPPPAVDDGRPPLPPGFGDDAPGLPPGCRRRASRSATDRAGVTMFAIAVVVLAALTGLLSAHAP